MISENTAVTSELDINDEGTKRWLTPNFWFHRVGGPAVIHPDGSEEWQQHGKLHRLDGPAIVNTDGSREWWVNGERHRTDGPAIIMADDSHYWFLDGVQITAKQWIVENN